MSRKRAPRDFVKAGLKELHRILQAGTDPSAHVLEAYVRLIELDRAPQEEIRDDLHKRIVALETATAGLNREALKSLGKPGWAQLEKVARR